MALKEYKKRNYEKGRSSIVVVRRNMQNFYKKRNKDGWKRNENR
jgi:hypothetical protein